MSEHSENQTSPVVGSLTIEQATGQNDMQSENFQPKLAGFWVRFWAYSIDLIVLYAISGLIIKPIFRVTGLTISNPAFLLFTPYKITVLVLLLVYFALMTKYFQQTVGKMIMGIKVVSQQGEQLTWNTIIFREVIGRFISKTLLIPYLLVIFTPRKESLHDLFADTYVVHENAYEREENLQYSKNY